MSFPLSTSQSPTAFDSLLFDTNSSADNVFYSTPYGTSYSTTDAQLFLCSPGQVNGAQQHHDTSSHLSDSLLLSSECIPNVNSWTLSSPFSSTDLTFDSSPSPFSPGTDLYSPSPITPPPGMLYSLQSSPTSENFEFDFDSLSSTSSSLGVTATLLAGAGSSSYSHHSPPQDINTPVYPLNTSLATAHHNSYHSVVPATTYTMQDCMTQFPSMATEHSFLYSSLEDTLEFSTWQQ